jgi:hypothetical protein
MAEFAEIIVTSLEISGAKDVVEVGAEFGSTTRKLLEYTKERGGKLFAIDPAPSPEAEALFEEENHATLLRDLSLKALPSLSADAHLIDGDHNFYTVYHESEIIWKRTRGDDRPFLVFYHDVGWPCGRRDSYYDPSSIPKEFQQPHSWELGVTLDTPDLIEGGFRGESNWAWAHREGGPRNGVLTAIEEFVKGKESQLAWAFIPAVFGLGVLFDKGAPWAENLAALLYPYHMNPLLERLERNRLECYLSVISWQDRSREAA